MVNNFIKNTNNFELLQQVRTDLVGEIQAVNQYEQHYQSTNDPIAKQTWKNIKNDELTHIGQLLALWNYLDASEQQLIEQGINEFMKIIKQ